MISIESVVARAIQHPAKAVVVTGGEPLMWNLDELCRLLKSQQIALFLETSGSYSLSGTWDWICLSPKRNSPPLTELLCSANELKVIISDKEDFDFAEENARLVAPKCKLWLQPEWSRSQKMMQKIVEYVLAHPRWGISLQSHKYMRIP
jgi:organic radical activating enzyme